MSKKQNEKNVRKYMTLYMAYFRGFKIDYNLIYDAWVRLPKDCKQSLIDNSFGIEKMEGQEPLYKYKERRRQKCRRKITFILTAVVIFFTFVIYYFVYHYKNG